MNDTFYEQIIVRKRGVYDYIAWVLSGALAFILAFLSFITFNPILLVILVILCFASYHFKIPSTRLEFEYSLLNNEMNVDMIINKAKRKSIKSFDIKTVKLLTFRDSPNLKEFVGTKQYNYSSNDLSVKSYVLVVSSNNVNEAYIMDLDEHMLSMIQNYIPRQIKL